MEVAWPQGKFKKQKSGARFGRETVALDVFVRDAPDGAAGGGEEEFFNGDTEEVDAEEIGDVVEAVDEIGVEEENAEEEEKIEESETGGAGEHQRDEVAAKVGDDDGADGKGDDGVDHGFVRMPKLEADEEDNDKNERSVVAFARLAAQRGECFFEQKLADHAGDAADSSGPEKIFDADADFLVEVEERWGRPILRDEEDAGEGHRRGDERAPADFGAIVFSKDRAEYPRGPKDERANEVGIVIARHDH